MTLYITLIVGIIIMLATNIIIKRLFIYQHYKIQKIGRFLPKFGTIMGAALGPFGYFLFINIGPSKMEASYLNLP